MITITKGEAEHILYSIKETIRWIEDEGQGASQYGIMDQLDASVEIIGACLRNEVEVPIN